MNPIYKQSNLLDLPLELPERVLVILAGSKYIYYMCASTSREKKKQNKTKHFHNILFLC